MKESELKRILTKPTMDKSMDQRMRESLLDIESHSDRMSNCYNYICSSHYWN